MIPGSGSHRGLHTKDRSREKPLPFSLSAKDTRAGRTQSPQEAATDKDEQLTAERDKGPQRPHRSAQRRACCLLPSQVLPKQYFCSGARKARRLAGYFRKFFLSFVTLPLCRPLPLPLLSLETRINKGFSGFLLSLFYCYSL